MSDEKPSGPRRLQDEIRQSKPFHSRSQEAYLALVRTADDVKRQYGRLLEGDGITMQQYNVLRILRGAGPEGLPTLTIGERMVERTPGVTRLIDRIEKKGLVRRERCSDDRRVVWCKITDEGLRLLGALEEPVRELDDTLFQALEPSELEALLSALDRLRDYFARQER